MEKGFLRFNAETKKMYRILLIGGTLLSTVLGILAYQEMKLSEGYVLPKNEAGEGAYEQELVAKINDKRIPLKVIVGEKIFTKAEAEKELNRAQGILDEVLKGANMDFAAITEKLCFVDIVPGTAVEVTWTDKAAEYLWADGTFREEVEIREPTKIKVSAILICQDFSRDYEVNMTLLPRAVSDEKRLLDVIDEKAEKEKDLEKFKLPKEFDGQKIMWRKPMDVTFLYVFALTILAAFVLKAGEKKDARDKKKALLEMYEKDYAQIVSKFTMLLSAGLSIRNAWERILLLYRGKPEENSPIVQEMKISYREMQKGVSELEVYEKFGIRVGHIYYKKLMAMFLSDKKRGSINLIDAMRQEMLQAWEEQRRSTKQQGEKIGTKLLLPMMGMLAVVFIIILIPAFLSFDL